MERDLRHDVAGRGLNILACIVLFVAVLGLVLFGLFVMSGRVPNPAPTKGCCMWAP